MSHGTFHSEFSDAAIERVATSYPELNAVPQGVSSDTPVAGIHLFHAGRPITAATAGVSELTLSSALKYVRAHEKSFVWVAIHEPTFEEVQPLVELFHLGSFTVEDIVRDHGRPKFEHHSNYDFFRARNVHYDPNPPAGSFQYITTSEVQLVIGANFVLTFSHAETPSFRHSRQRLLHSPELASLGPISVLYSVLDTSVDGYRLACEQVDDAIDEMEQTIFDPDQETHIEPVYMLKREVLEMRRAIVPLASVLTEIHQKDRHSLPSGTKSLW